MSGRGNKQPQKATSKIPRPLSEFSGTHIASAQQVILQSHSQGSIDQQHRQFPSPAPRQPILSPLVRPLITGCLILLLIALLESISTLHQYRSNLRLQQYQIQRLSQQPAPSPERDQNHHDQRHQAKFTANHNLPAILPTPTP